MALSQEEISIRLGVDSKAVKSGMYSAGAVIEDNLRGFKKKFHKFSGDILSGSVMGFFGSITDTITALVKDGVDKLSDYISTKLFDTIYGVNERLSKTTSGMFSESNAAGRIHESAAAEMARLDAEEARRVFESKSAEDRKSESAESLKQTNAELTAAKDAVVKARQEMKELRALNSDNQLAASEGAKKIADAEAKVLEVRKRNIQATKDYRQALKDISNTASDNLYSGRQFSFAQPFAAPTGMEAVNNYLSMIKSSSDAYKAKTDYSGWGKALKQAQKEAADEVVQKVAIVEIKE